MKLCEALYSLLLDRINALPYEEKQGSTEDLLFMSNEFWLQDTAVIDHVMLRKGMYYVTLVFSHHSIPYRWLCRGICGYADVKKAILGAHYMRRQAAKDQRGTLTISMERYMLNNN